ncbi:4-hydroxythreonine-4-phosphate dehydrogenase PdxA [Geobacter sp. DSM 9736]|uniref:4-hydroxythreonine-4-phosphate dehydrogenase PdxA n=1 Tax=Geobacter sp. DSM 9736 TaxID=1277350 RepID=UPI000B506F5B|nr:4-hydroxythreonine-4-phosphate dehydrogenase PdxA [Geobacter sp. DSM 9736]SNB47563.1 4-hydroxythreonine-4-phosphate dehydrogenase [Geobacter sp. DSM 9736]
MKKPLISVTMGDPTGIGPEIIASALSDPDVRRMCCPFVVGDSEAMARAVRITGVNLNIRTVSSIKEVSDHENQVCLLPMTKLSQRDLEFGKPTDAVGEAVYRYIVEATRLCMAGAADAMVTAPINKEVMNRAGHNYPGHTELLAKLTSCDNYVMMLAGTRLRVSLVTIHEPLRAVPSLLSTERVLKTIRTTWKDVSTYFCTNPRLAILALNPHCSEGGMFGDEEESIIKPAVDAACAEGINAVGPLSADTLFHFAVGGEYDAVICMYHDQGLIPLKLLHFDDGVNVTLGLPIIRTSVDHGTAYGLAGTGKASPASMIAATKMATEMAIRKLRLEIEK